MLVVEVTKHIIIGVQIHGQILDSTGCTDRVVDVAVVSLSTDVTTLLLDERFLSLR